MKQQLEKPKDIPLCIWLELSTQEKLDRINNVELEMPYPFVDYNKIPFETLVEQLYRRYMFLSNGDAYIINRLIDFWKENNKK